MILSRTATNKVSLLSPDSINDSKVSVAPPKGGELKKKNYSDNIMKQSKGALWGR